MSTILITGAAGSLGSILTDIYAEQGHTVRAYDINEAGLADLKQKYGTNIRAIYGDVTDRDRLEFALRGVDIVIHTAAMKNIIISESNVEQTIKTNINGTLNVAMSAMAQGVKKAIFISSDKSVESVLVYGDSKALGEKIWKWSHSISRQSIFSIIRPGNFWESRGNVFETWDRQVKDGNQITLTDPQMERYFIPTVDVARFVLQVEDMMQGGEIYIPHMKLYNMHELAEEYAKKHGCGIKITGAREGEKLIEKLWSQHESSKVQNKNNYLQDKSNYWIIK